MHNTVWLQMSHSVVCVCYIVAVKAASLSSFVMPLSEGGVALSKEEKCVHVWNQGLERRGGVQACFLFARHLPPFLPPSLPPSGSGSMHSTLTHTPTASREHTHILHYLPRTCLGEDSMCVCELWGWKRECVWSRLTSTSIDPPLLSTTDPWHM